jgi:succinylarginine dihydrolase
VIDAGVFHNDVIAVGHRELLFCHEAAFAHQAAVLSELQQKFGDGFSVITVSANDVSVDEAVKSYLFNSQLLSKPDGKMAIVVPEECRINARVWPYLQSLVTSHPTLNEALVFDLRESMMNGGGPACLRLRVELNATEANAVNPNVVMNDVLFARLTAWVQKHYRDRMADADLAEPTLINEVRAALDELTVILKLGSVYPFQL